MVDVDFLSPENNDCIWALHVEVISRALRGYGVVEGNRVEQTSTPSMTVNVGSGKIKVANNQMNVSSGQVQIPSAHAYLSRVDIISRNSDGNLVLTSGTPASVEDPLELGDWHKYTSPAPPVVPAGHVILAAVFVNAGATSIDQTCIWMIAGGLPAFQELPIVTTIRSSENAEDDKIPSEKATRSELDLLIPWSSLTTTLGIPGSDVKVVSEKALRENFDAKVNVSAITTSIGTPGVDNKIPSEKAVRTELGLLVPMSYITTSISSPGSDSKIPTEKAARTVFDTKADLSILTTAGDIIYRGSSTWTRLGIGSQNSMLIAGSGAPAWSTLTSYLDNVVGSTSGLFLKRGSSQWEGVQLTSKRYIDFPARGFRFAGSYVPEYVLVEGTYGTQEVLAFDDTTEEFADAEFIVPDDILSSGTVVFEIWGRAKTPASNKYVRYKLSYSARTSGQTRDYPFSESISNDLLRSSTSGVRDKHQWGTSVSTLAWSPGKLVRIRLSRVAPVGANLPGDDYIEMFRIIIPTVVYA